MKLKSTFRSKQQRKNQMNRREFIEITGKAICACSLGTTPLLINSCSAQNPVSPNTEGIELTFDLNDDSLQILKTEGGSVITSGNELDSMGILLLREGNSIKAFANRCTHASYDLRPFDDSGLSTCIGHGAQFNTHGEAVTGPATRSLKSFETLLDENELTVFGG